MKTCSKCSIPQPETNFSTTGRIGSNWKRKECNACRTIDSKCSRYKITKEQYFELMNEYNFKCGICYTSDSLCIDHDHITGRVRGILCRTCNLTLGRMNEDTKRLYKMISYLNKDTIRMEGQDILCLII